LEGICGCTNAKRGVRREVRNLTVMSMDPNQSPEQAALIKELERSARAEQRLRKKALDYAKSRKT